MFHAVVQPSQLHNLDTITEIPSNVFLVLCRFAFRLGLGIMSCDFPSLPRRLIVMFLNDLLGPQPLRSQLQHGTPLLPNLANEQPRFGHGIRQRCMSSEQGIFGLFELGNGHVGGEHEDRGKGSQGEDGRGDMSNGTEIDVVFVDCRRRRLRVVHGALMDVGVCADVYKIVT